MQYRSRVTMTNARHRIAETVHVARHGVAIDDATDQIIAIVREALLSEAATNAAIDVISYRSIEPYAATSEKEVTEDWHETLSAALTAAFGADDDGGES